MRQRRKYIVLALVMALTLSNISVPQVEAKSKTPSVKKSITLTVGQKKTIKVKGSNIKSKKFSVTKGKKFISVNKKGTVKAKKKGTAKVKVTIKYKSGKKLKSKKLYVKVKVVSKPSNTTVKNNNLNKPTTKPSATSTTTSTPSTSSGTSSPQPSEKPSEEPSEKPSEEPTQTPENGVLVEDGKFVGYTGTAKTLSIPEGVTEIAENALEGSTVKSVELPSTLTKIGARAFKGCSSLQELDCPETVVGVGDLACEDCTSLESISIPNKNAEIGEKILEGCTSLTSAYIPAASGCKHEYMEIKIEPNCTQKGTDICICKDCGNIDNKELQPLGHDIETVRTEPTCTKDGMEKKVCKRCDAVLDITVLDALGHNYEENIVKPTCTDKGYTSHVCSRCKDSYKDKYVDALGHDFVGWVTNIPATCTEKGKQVGVCSRCSLESFKDLLATGHTYGTPTYEWSDDGSSCTAKRICESDSSHVETEEAVIKSSVETSATCGNKGTTRYTATFENEAFDTQTKDIADIPVTGHDWGDVTYSWSDTGDKCRATRICKSDSSHIESEEVSTTSSVKTNPTCTEKGVTEYTATFSNEVFGTDTKNIVDIPATGHDWGEPIYEWSEDGKSCTATRTCENDSSHIERESGVIIDNVKVNATCTEKGTTEYTATFENNTFATQTKDVIDIPATGHSYGTVNYTWSADNRTCTAKRVCENDPSHIEKEDSTVKLSIKENATCEFDGTTTYTAEFENSAFETQIKDIKDIDAIGHSYGEPVYTWSSDGKSCTAKRVCKNDSSHVEAENAIITSNIKIPATCLTDGTTEYTATFENNAFTTQTKDVVDIPSTGHSWGTVSYSWSDDGKSCTARRVCENDPNHIETESGVITDNVKVSATCTEKGTTEYTATFENNAFATQTKDVVDIPATGHNWGETSYSWSNDGKSCTATRTCQNDFNHVETEDAIITDRVKTPATCTEKGTTEYTAEFENSAFTTQTKDVVDIPATGHTPHDGYCTVCNAKIAGLYDGGGNLLCTWKNSRIDVEKDYDSATYNKSTTSPYYVIKNNYPSTTKVVVPDGVTSIGERAFNNCVWLVSITIPDSVTSIGSYAFQYCSGLTSITIPDSVTSIGKYTFMDCSKLTSIAIQDGVTSIGSGTFKGCSALTSITIPDSVTSIGHNAFRSCSKLTNITIPDSVTSIGIAALYGCSGLTSIIIPDSVTSIGSSAFQYCTGLTSISVSDENTVYDSRENCNAIIKTATNTLISGCKNTSIPDGVKSIEAGAFRGCSGLTSITIPDGVTSIEAQTFYECSGLASITIPDSVTSIGSYAFQYCKGLTNITIPSSVTSIGEWAFYGCSGLTSVTFKNTTGWYVGVSAGYKTKAISSSDLANTSTSATYLKSTYYNNYWTR